MTNTTEAPVSYVSEFDKVKVLVELEAGDIHPDELNAASGFAMRACADEGYAFLATWGSGDVAKRKRWTLTGSGEDRLAGFRRLFEPAD